MTIKEAEEQTGLARSNIRFYEKEKLIQPSRNDKNGYRDYSQKDIETIKKIAYLRTLEISIEDIRDIMSGKVSLTEMIKKQTAFLQTQIDGLNKAKIMCERMLKDGNISFEELQAEQYVSSLDVYWNDNRTVFKQDAVSFLYVWGSRMIWIILTALCFLAAAVSYAKLPPDIPVQWYQGEAVSFADKKFIFLCPLACMIIRIWLRPVIFVKLLRNRVYGELITEYLSNYACFIVLSAELFSILYAHGLCADIAVVLLADTAVFMGILAVAVIKTGYFA